MVKLIKKVKQRIDKNYHAIKVLEKSLNQFMPDEEKIELINLCGLLYSEYVTGVYSSSILEKELSQIGNKIEIKNSENSSADNKYLFVMTKANNIGGHSVLVNNWILWDKKNKYSIAFTEYGKEDVPFFLKKAVEASGGELYYLYGSHYEKAKQLLKISLTFSKIILIQHMYDVIPNLAYCNPEFNIPVILYNHANFKFSFGYHISDMVLNLLEYDVKKTIIYRGVDESKSLILQFPNAGEKIRDNNNECFSIDMKSICLKYGIDCNKKLVVSMGDGFKFGSIENYDFIAFVKEFICSRNNDTQYIIIGPDPNKQEWKNLEYLTQGNAKAIGYIRREEAETLISFSNLYIVSFPMSSFGASVAEKNNVPYLYLAVIEREIENYKENTVFTVQELLNKSNEILDGNKEKYQGTYYERILGQKEWCSKWYSIVNNVSVHTGQQIHPQRLIQTEEIVNCQLMQEKASENVKRILPQLKLTPNIIRTLIEVNEKYQLDCIPEHFSIVEYNTYQQQNQLLQQKMNLLAYINKWLNLKLKGYKIADYFHKRDIRNIAIYGMGQIGLNLFEELKDSLIEVECFIDRNAKKMHAPIKIIDLHEVPVRSLVIVTTAWIEEEQLRKDYTCLTDEYQIISLFEVIDILGKGD